MVLEAGGGEGEPVEGDFVATVAGVLSAFFGGTNWFEVEDVAMERLTGRPQVVEVTEFAVEGGVGDAGLFGEFADGGGLEGFALLDGAGGDLEAAAGVLED